MINNKITCASASSTSPFDTYRLPVPDTNRIFRERYGPPIVTDSFGLLENKATVFENTNLLNFLKTLKPLSGSQITGYVPYPITLPGDTGTIPPGTFWEMVMGRREPARLIMRLGDTTTYNQIISAEGMAELRRRAAQLLLLGVLEARK
jgi:hypothetical protein